MNSDHAELFTEWKQRDIHSGKLFITDGIIDEEKWEQAEFKPLFLLKEAYDSEKNSGEGWDLCQLIREEWGGPKYKMWWTVAQWAYGVKQLAAAGDVALFPDRHADEAASAEEDLKNALLASAVVNIKKSGGKSGSDDDLKRYAKEDWDLIKRQINIIRPDIVICGYTFHFIKDLFSPRAEYTREWVYKAEGLYFVDYYHPANRFPDKINYYALCTLIRVSRVLGRKCT